MGGIDPETHKLNIFGNVQYFNSFFCLGQIWNIIAGEPHRIRLRIRLRQHPGQALSSTNKHTRKDDLNFTDTLINN
jgi:hypothetical protein